MPSGQPRQRHCDVDGCSRPHNARGLCGVHYCRMRKTGSVELSRAPNGAPLAFLREALLTNTKECLNWPYATDRKGYGRVNFEGRMRSAPSVLLELRDGSAPDGMHAAHEPETCHNPTCVNPNHLRWASPSENIRDQLIDGTKPLGQEVYGSVLTPDLVAKIRSSPLGDAALSRELGINSRTISDVRHRRTWKHIP